MNEKQLIKENINHPWNSINLFKLPLFRTSLSLFLCYIGILSIIPPTHFNVSCVRLLTRAFIFSLSCFFFYFLRPPLRVSDAVLSPISPLIYPAIRRLCFSPAVRGEIHSLLAKERIEERYIYIKKRWRSRESI